MNITIRINAGELDEQIIRALKEMFGNKDIEINVAEVWDDTDYLFNSPNNAKIIEERIRQTAAGKNQIKVTIDELEKLLVEEKGAKDHQGASFSV